MSEENTKALSTRWIGVGGVEISAGALLLELKLGLGAELVEQLALRKVASAMAQRLDLHVAPDEINEAVTAFYSDRRLFDAAQIAEWNIALQVDEAALHERLHESLLVARLRTKLVTDDKVRNRFGVNPHRYARAEVEVFSFTSEGAAKEFVLAVHENEAEAIHGARRWTVREELPDEAGVLIFASEPGDVVGPVELEIEQYEVYRVLRRERPMLDAGLQRRIRDELFDEILRGELARAPLRFMI